MNKGYTKATLGGKLLHPSDYIAAVEFGGRDVTLTIKSVSQQDLHVIGTASKKERKPILEFVETKKKLVCNKINAGSIADLHGIRAEDWIGKKITLYPTTWNGDPCIRVRERVGKSAPLPPEVAADPLPHDPEPHGDPDAFDDALATAVEQGVDDLNVGRGRIMQSGERPFPSDAPAETLPSTSIPNALKPMVKKILELRAGLDPAYKIMTDAEMWLELNDAAAFEGTPMGPAYLSRVRAILQDETKGGGA